MIDMYKFIQKICNFFNAFPKDKWLHFSLALIFEIILYPILFHCGLKLYAAIAAPALVLVACFLKEVLDNKHGGDADWADMVFGFFGVFLGLCLIGLFLSTTTMG